MGVWFRQRGGPAAVLVGLLTLAQGAVAQDDAVVRDASLSSAMDLVESIFDGAAALELVEELDPYYRDRGNNGYMRSLEACAIRCQEAGFRDPSEPGALDTIEFRDFGQVEPAWTPVSASLTVVSPDVGVLHSFEDEAGLERCFVAPNSFPTKDEGVVAPLVRYEHSKPVESYAGSVVYGTLPTDVLFSRAVEKGGALGVISSYLPDYNDPDINRDAIRFSRIPYDAEHKGFGLNVSPTKRDLLERLLDGGMVYVKVAIDADFTQSRSRTLVGTIAGSDPHAGTVALVAHLDEPGSNDNASGVAATIAMATGYLRALNEGRLERPRRTITFLIGTEFECSAEWLRSVSGKVDMGLIVDMVGEDHDENGAWALVERMPDPGAIWDRPPLDIHSEWGRGDVRQSDLKGSFLNDYVMGAMSLRAKRVGWKIRSNPYEGGSDHESFLERGIPAVLLWHFTDPYYHTSLDRLDKVSRSEMENVAVPTLTLVHHFSHAGYERAEEVLGLVMEAARNRLDVESENARNYLKAPAVVGDASQRLRVSERERTILVAWSHWYREAVLSLEEFEPGIGTSPERASFEASLDEALTELRSLERAARDSLDV